MMKLRTAIAGVCLLVLSAAAQAAPDEKEIIRQARDAYYNLASRGFVSFTCSATPNWDALLADLMKSDQAAAQKSLAKLRQIKFTVTISSARVTKVTHSEAVAPDETTAAALKQIYDGMEEMMSGFFETWSSFMIASPFPAVDSEYKLQHGVPAILTYKDGNSDVTTTMDKEFVIKDLRIVSPDAKSSLQPQLGKSAQGFLMTGFRADYVGKTPAETTKLHVDIAYQEVSGLQIPSRIRLDGSSGGNSFGIEMVLSGCQVTKK